MRNLLRANFMRLWKSRTFWGCMALMAFYGFRVVYHLREGDGTLDSPSFLFFTDVGILLAVYYAAFVSGEYGDGIIRNKLMVGMTRPAIYFANLISCITAGLLMCVAFIIPNWTLTYIFFGQIRRVHYIRTPSQLVLSLLASAVVIVSYSALFSMLGMNIQHKAAGPVAVVAAASALYLNGMQCGTELALYQQAPERYHYSNLRLVYDHLFAEWLPGGQARIYGQNVGCPSRALELMAYSFVVIAVSTGIGLLLFRRKDLK